MTERSNLFEALNLSEEEEQLVLMLREWQDMSTNFRLEIEKLDGAWDITMHEIDSHRITRGTGGTFDATWSAMEPTQFQGPSGKGS